MISCIEVLKCQLLLFVHLPLHNNDKLLLAIFNSYIFPISSNNTRFGETENKSLSTAFLKESVFFFKYLDAFIADITCPSS